MRIEEEKQNAVEQEIHADNKKCCHCVMKLYNGIKTFGMLENGLKEYFRLGQ